jgi:hypothetical protein
MNAIESMEPQSHDIEKRDRERPRDQRRRAIREMTNWSVKELILRGQTN